MDYARAKPERFGFMKIDFGKMLFPKLARDQRRKKMNVIWLALGVGLAVSLIFIAVAILKIKNLMK
jgi:hypothetical protein